MATCIFDGCGRQTKSPSGSHCPTHVAQWLRTSRMWPISAKPGPRPGVSPIHARLRKALEETLSPVTADYLASAANVESRRLINHLKPLIEAGEVKVYNYKKPFRYALSGDRHAAS